MLINTEYFRLVAKHYEKYKRYPDGNFGTSEYDTFWRDEIKKCKYGVKIGDTWISGYHYFYLNYWRILKVERRESGLVEREERNTLTKSKGERIESFPDFWDVDFEFFQEIEKAEAAGEHFMWLKPRGVGASWKGASMLARNFFLFKKSKGYMIAYEKEYLQKDGLLTKFVDGREFILRTHPVEKDRYLIGFAKPSDFKKSFSDMHYVASTKDPETGEAIGFMSELMGISIKDDPDKPRGKRGKLIIYEEMGKFPNVDSVWNISRSGMEEQDVTYGLMLGFGTGGTKNADFTAFEKMFYSPDAFAIRFFDNIYDDNASGTKCAFFTPAYKTIQFKDKDGNSNILKGKEFVKTQREQAKLSPDSNELLQNQAEYPEKPQEAILNTVYRTLPSTEAKEHRIRVVGNKSYELGIPGKLENINGEIKFFPHANTNPPIVNFPFTKKDDITGCVVIYHPPIKKDAGEGVMKIPDNLYIIGHDPYAQDESTGDSIGATYVYMNTNNIIPPGDKLVATYFGRPAKQDDYNRILFMLAEYYNAMIGFENDAGDVVGYAKRFHKLEWLFEEFECGWDDTIKTKNARRTFGVSMSSGRNNKRKLQGDKYLSDWLLSPRGKGLNGESKLNLHTINCIFTLRQIENYNLKGNFDAISALRVLEYFKKELEYKEISVKLKKVYRPNSLFNKKIYV